MTVPVNVLQADNQLFGAYRTAMLFVTPAAKKDIAENTHALCISAHKIPNMGWNAEIFKVETLESLNKFQLILYLGAFSQRFSVRMNLKWYLFVAEKYYVLYVNNILVLKTRKWACFPSVKI